MDNKAVLTGVIVVIVIAAGIFFLSRSNKAEDAQVASSPSVDLDSSLDSTTAPESSTPATAEETSAATTGAVKEFTITGSNYKFSPNSMSVKVGDTVKITFKSSGGDHDLVIDEFNVATKELGSGESDTVEFVADKAGSYEFYCSISNHRAMGMTGTLTVN